MSYFNKSFLVLFTLFLYSCQDTITVVDTNIELKNRNWSYAEKIKVPVKIESADIPYNIYFNLRLTDEYKYSNIFILIHFIDPSGKKITERKEFTLALADGEWLGSGSGNKLFYQLKFKSNFKFPKSGTYVFELEQNMRDNPLNYISDAGIRVEKAQ
jgi:gliding motility-associated lipoprotein GldH